MSDQPAGLPAPRLERLIAAAQERNLAHVVLVGAELVGWATGYHRWLGGPYALVLDDEGARTLVAPAYEEAAAERSGVFDAVVPFGDQTLGLNLDLMEMLAGRLRDVVSDRRVAVAGEAVVTVPGAVDLSEAVRDIRLRKDADEVEALRAAFAHALEGQRAVADAAVPGVSEIELFSVAHAAAQQRAGCPLGFVCDLVSGRRTGAAFGPVNVAGSRTLQSNDVVVADVAVGAAFWGDSARTVIVGEPPEGLARACSEVQAVLDGVAPRLMPGASCASIYEWVRTQIEERLPGWTFPHHAGHGVGASVFEDPHLIPRDTTELEVGMVVAVEPGAYLPDRYGVRLEDMFIVTEAGGRRLTS